MNNLQPYEKHLADKLHQVPVPDKEEGWIEMRKLLDRDKPEGGGGWGGNRKWWWMGLTVAIIIAGLWTSQQFNEQQQIASQPGSATSNENALNKTSTPSSEKNLATEKNELNSTTNDASSTVEKKNTADKTAVKENSTANANSSENVEAGSDKKDLTKAPATAVTSSNTKTRIKIDNADIILATTRTQYSVPNNKNNLSKISGTKNAGISNANNVALIVGNKQKNSNGVVSDIFNSTSVANDPVVNTQGTKVYKTPEENAFVSSYLTPVALSEQTFENPEDRFYDFPAEMQPLKAEPGKTDKDFTKAMRKKSIQDDNRKMSKKSMRGIGIEKEHDLTLAVGLSIPQSFAIGSQQSPSYGVNAKPGKASDYIPVPFVQYHFNNRLFLQTELQFQSPQFTDRLLISQSQHQISPASGMLEKNIYIEKLYYFNIPLNIYYSPAKNFYIGSGIQYSNLLSGVATYQDNRYSNGVLQNSNSRVQGFKEDSVAAKLAQSEWRYQLEGNYYFSRFTFGARYNQALKQFVNLQPSPTLPFTQGRNQSFLIYLRYNIWEERKKNVYSLAGN